MLRTLARLEPRSSLGLLILVTLVLVIPKINLVSFGPYEGAGLRIEDFLILTFFVLLGPIWFWYARAATRTEVAFFLFFTVSVVSLLANLAFDRGSILYALRIVEYWALFYAGVLASRFGIANKVLGWLLVLNCIAVGLQYFHLIGGWSNGVFVENLTRPTGLTNGAYEAPFVVGLISVFLIRQLAGWWLYGSIMLATSAILMTGARIVIFGYLIAVLLSFLPKRRYSMFRRRRRVLAPLSALAIVTVISLFAAPQVFERFGGLANFKLISMEVAEIYLRAGGERNGASGEDFKRTQLTLRTQGVKSYIEDELSLSADLSLLVRTNKWFWGIKSFFNQNVLMYFVGVGPGTMGNALDGGFLRILIETGVLGTLAFVYFLYCVVRIDRERLLPVVIFFILCNLVIDYYLASKPMMTLLFIIGIALATRQEVRDLAPTR
jgi:hypothetical protein